MPYYERSRFKYFKEAGKYYQMRYENVEGKEVFALRSKKGILHARRSISQTNYVNRIKSWSAEKDISYRETQKLETSRQKLMKSWILAKRKYKRQEMRFKKGKISKRRWAQIKRRYREKSKKWGMEMEEITFGS